MFADKQCNRNRPYHVANYVSNNPIDMVLASTVYSQRYLPSQ